MEAGTTRAVTMQPVAAMEGVAMRPVAMKAVAMRPIAMKAVAMRPLAMKAVATYEGYSYI